MISWHPKAKRVPHQDGGSFYEKAGRKLVWHTTEGTGLPAYKGTAPHFTLDPKTGELYQHVPISRAARALAHPNGTVETNRANAIQVELIGYARDTVSWPSAYYERIAELARWIEEHAGISRQATVEFRRGAARLAPLQWLRYEGHIGHQHVPHNDHWDPGEFRIDDVLGGGKRERWARRLRRDRRIANERRDERRMPWPRWLRTRARRRRELLERDK